MAELTIAAAEDYFSANLPPWIQDMNIAIESIGPDRRARRADLQTTGESGGFPVRPRTVCSPTMGVCPAHPFAIVAVLTLGCAPADAGPDRRAYEDETSPA